MNARETILRAIRDATVPPAPPAAPVTCPAGDAALLDAFVAALESVGGRAATRRPDQSLHDLVVSLAGNGGVATVIRGRFGVAENGAVYVDAADLGERSDVVRGDQLVIVVPATMIVASMHEAVRLIPAGSPCGWFVSGPSKTADIEQSLVIGAQGARTLHVVLDG